MKYDINTTTLSSFKNNHKACIGGLIGAFEAPLNFDKRPKFLKVLVFHF